MSWHHQPRLRLQLRQLGVLLVLVRAHKSWRQPENALRVHLSGFCWRHYTHGTCANVGVPLVCVRVVKRRSFLGVEVLGIKLLPFSALSEHLVHQRENFVSVAIRLVRDVFSVGVCYVGGRR